MMESQKGASDDIYKATKVAENIICCYKMDDEIGLAYIENIQNNIEVRKK